MATETSVETATNMSTVAYEKRIILAMRRVMQEMDMHSKHLSKLYDITVPQVVCLYELFERGAMTLAVLSSRVHLSSSTLVGIMDRLEEKKFITRTRGSADRRSVFIDITEEGRKFVLKSPHLLHNRLHDSLKRLPESEQIIIANSLELLVQLLREDSAPQTSG